MILLILLQKRHELANVCCLFMCHDNIRYSLQSDGNDTFIFFVVNFDGCVPVFMKAAGVVRLFVCCIILNVICYSLK